MVQHLSSFYIRHLFHHRVCESLKWKKIGGDHLGCFFEEFWTADLLLETMRFEEVEQREFVDVSHEDLRRAMTHVCS